MAPMAFDNTNRNQLESTAPATSLLDMNHLAGPDKDVRKLCSTMEKMQNIGGTSMSQFPDLQLVGFDSPAKSSTPTSTDSNVTSSNSSNKPCPDSSSSRTDATGSDAPSQTQRNADATTPRNADATTQRNADATTQPGDQSWRSHMNEPWVQDALKNNPGWHAMEGLHPGEIAVGNWEPSKQEKKILGDAVDKMLATGNDGPLAVTLPDGSVCTIEIKHNGQGGMTFLKGSDQANNGTKHRKMTYGSADSADDTDAPAEDCDATNSSATNSAGTASPLSNAALC
ncbi:MAG TPA: hypothetical protein V6C89_02925 [Drouetiella sp.]|jgi:hypothetical protein